MSSEGALAFALAQAAADCGADGVVYAGGDAGLIDRLAPMARGFLPGLAVVILPPWDTLPYDRVRPSRGVTGRRAAALTELAAGRNGPCLVLTTPEALVQRVPPRDRVLEREVELSVGSPLDPQWLQDTLTGFGYRFEEVVDEPGEAAIRDSVIDIYPADAAAPYRLDVTDGRLSELSVFDNQTQRSTEARTDLRVRPASEAFTVPGEPLPARVRRLLPDGPLESLFDYVAGARFILSEDAEARMRDWLELVRDSHAIRQATATPDMPVLTPPDRLYLRPDELDASLGAQKHLHLDVPAAPEEFVESLPSAAAAATLIRRHEQDAIVLFAPDSAASWQARLQRRLQRRVELLQDWQSAQQSAGGTVSILPLPLSQGFALPGKILLALPPSAERRRSGNALLDRLTHDMRIGDLVVEPEHGLARLTGLEPLGEPVQSECLVLGFARDNRLLVPGQQAGTVWRYGADAALKPDQLQGASWVARRKQVEADLAKTAKGILERTRERQAIRTAAIETDARYQRFVRRVPFRLGRDQRRAIDAVLQDLASEHPMHRLVCGDVGYGKTEIALHAAAATALAGYQVAVVAPTTLLATQHLEAFRARFQGTGIRVEPLIRASRSATAQATLQGLADGSIHIVVGTQSVAGRQVRFAKLGLVVIDEEQRFGQAHKRHLRNLQGGTNTLVMTATPLPRSLQAALAGMVDVNLLTEPPTPRDPVRSFVAPFDPAVVRAALLRESRRGGHSFVVCPRIEDIEPMQAKLRELVPELSLLAVHGRMRPDALDKAMLDFANGRVDVLLATNIIEAGLNLPNANTMLVWRAERFGLAQLHQLRGRVGRGRTRGIAYLLTDPDRALPAAARKRLDTLAALQGSGAGFAISAADLDLRGAGDLLGEQQAGHLRLLGTELYRHLLVRALQRARGERSADDWDPDISLDVPAYVPEAFIVEPDLRLEIYRRLAALQDQAAVTDVAEELVDRFGDLPPPLAALVALTRLRLLCRALGIREVQAGPRAVALRAEHEFRKELRAQGDWKDGRLLLPIAEPDPQRRLARLADLLASAGA